MNEKREPGTLGKLAAIATALTAILTLVFLIFPNIKPSAQANSQKDAPSTDRAVETPKLELDVEGERVIRAVLAAHQETEAKMETALKPLDRDPPAPTAGSAEQSAYLVALMDNYQNAERVSREQIAGMENLKLAATPVKFRQAFQAHLAAQRDAAHTLAQASALAAGAAFDVRTQGSEAYQAFFSKLAAMGPRTTEVDNAVSRTWADTKAAALEVGIE